AGPPTTRTKRPTGSETLRHVGVDPPSVSGSFYRPPRCPRAVPDACPAGENNVWAVVRAWPAGTKRVAVGAPGRGPVRCPAEIDWLESEGLNPCRPFPHFARPTLPIMLRESVARPFAEEHARRVACGGCSYARQGS